MKRNNKSPSSNIEIDSEGDTSVTGDVVGHDKTASEVNVNVTLQQRIGDQQNRRALDASRQIQDSLVQKRLLFMQNLVIYYSIFLGGISTIVVGGLLLFGIISLTKLILPGTAGGISANTVDPTSTPQSLMSLQQGVTVTLEASNCDAEVEIVNEIGAVLLSITIAPNMPQTINLPSGSYTYNVKYKCTGGLGGASGLGTQAYSSDFAVTSTGNVNIVLPSPPKLQIQLTSEQVAGIVLLVIGVILLSLVFIKMKHPTLKDTALFHSTGDRNV